jgi:hypothetical protein
MEPVNEFRLHPVGNHNARQSHCARPHPRRRVKADGAGDENERSGPYERKDQSSGDNFHKGVLFLDASNASVSEVRERQSPDARHKPPIGRLAFPGYISAVHSFRFFACLQIS